MRVRPLTKREEIEQKYNLTRKEDDTFKKTLNEVVFNSSYINVDIKELPSKGKAYTNGSKVSYSPLNYGEVKFMSSSDLSEEQLIEFFLSKITTNFEKEYLTYDDFLFLTTLIKLSTVGTDEFIYTWQCNKCKSENKKLIKLHQLEFYDLDIKLPIELDFEGETLEFYPITVKDYKDILQYENVDFYNHKMAKALKNKSYEEAYDYITKKLVGKYVSVIESFDVLLSHGVKDLKLVCENETDSGEVCGNIATVPFRALSENASSSDATREFLRNRIRLSV